MKRVSFKIANTIAKAGYFGKYNKICVVEQIVDSKTLILNKDHELINEEVPTYIETWLWLWRDKKLYIDVDLAIGTEETVSYLHYNLEAFESNDPEEAIKKAIEYLIDNDLIK